MVDLKAHFAQHTGDMVELLRQLVEFESPSTDKASTDGIGHLVGVLAEACGAQVASRRGGRWGDHIVGRWGGGQPGFLILCHLDTVWPVGTLQKRPWRLAQGRAYGPGALDDKSGVVVALTAIRELYGQRIPPCMPVTILLNSDEEVGSRSSRAVIEEHAAGANVVLCMEPATPDGALKVWRKGTGRYTVTAFGRAVHSGSDHEKGVNAIEELSHQVLRLQAMTDYSRGTTVNVGWMRGGTRTNIVPDRAEARIDLRVASPAEGVRMDAAIRSVQPVLPGASVTIEGDLSRPPMEASDVTLEPFRRAKEIGAQLGLELEAGGSGGASDANFTAAMGVPTLDGLGGVGDGAHSVGEYVWIASLPERAALMAALLTGWE